MSARQKENVLIRNMISSRVSKNNIDSRILANDIANILGIPVFRVFGNMSYMMCKEQSVNIIRNKPHSVLYM